MIWHKPSTWFHRNEASEEMVLRCMNPLCGRPIEEEAVCYEPNVREIYHVGECAVSAQAYRVLETRQKVSGNFEYITREKAERLLRADVIKGLESKI